MSLILTKPTREPVSLSEAKRQLNVEHDDDDALIERLIVVARQHIETVASTSIVRQKRRKYFKEFKSLYLPFGPVQAIDQIQYFDSNNAQQTLSTAIYEKDAEKDCVILSYDQDWPDIRSHENSVWVDYWCGYFDNTVSPIQITEDIPEDLCQALLMLVGDLYLSRESQVDINLYKNAAFDMAIGPYVQVMQ